jgi:hypothetical protein
MHCKEINILNISIKKYALKAKNHQKNNQNNNQNNHQNNKKNINTTMILNIEII